MPEAISKFLRYWDNYE